MDSTKKIGTAIIGGAIMVLGVNAAFQPNGGVATVSRANASTAATNGMSTMPTNSTAGDHTSGHDDKSKKGSCSSCYTPPPK